MDNSDNPTQGIDLCRVCKTEGTPEEPLYHPCLCVGSLMYIHEKCLVKWMKDSTEDHCELCHHQIPFVPGYVPDTPPQFTIFELASGIIYRLLASIKWLFYYMIVAYIWLYYFPCVINGVYQGIYTGSIDFVSILLLNMFSLNNLFENIVHGLFIIFTITGALVGIGYLLNKITDEDAPDWLVRDEPNNLQQFFKGLLQNLVEKANEKAHQKNQNKMDWINYTNVLHFFGLDGSYTFLENVFLMMIAFYFFIMVLDFFPYQIGNSVINAISLQDVLAASHYKSFLNILCGYCFIAMCLLIMYTFAKRTKRAIGISYIIVKVFLLSIFDSAIFPLVSGLWLDICSLTMFYTSLNDRLTSFHLAPNISMFYHWFVGILLINFFKLFVQLFQEVVRPDEIFFFCNLHNPNINITQNLIKQGIMHHGQRRIKALMIYGTVVILFVWLPIQILKCMGHSFLPHNTQLNNNYVNELNLEFQAVLFLITLSSYKCIHNWLKMVIRFWCKVIFFVNLLGIKSYYLVKYKHPLAADLIDYTRPIKFISSLVVLLIMVPLLAFIISLSFIIVFICWSEFIVLSNQESTQISNIDVMQFEITFLRHYFALTTPFFCFLVSFFFIKHSGFHAQLKSWFIIGSKATFILIVLPSLIPYLYGLFFDLIMWVQFHDPLHQTPLIWEWQDLALGLICIEVACFLQVIKSDWSFRQAIKHAHRIGFISMNLNFLMQNLTKPVIAVLGLSSVVPYIQFINSLMLLALKSNSITLLIGQIYPTLIFMGLVINVICGIISAKSWMMILKDKFKKLCQHIKNVRYNFGLRLVDYYHTNI